jgi:hypothetical protein
VKGRWGGGVNDRCQSISIGPKKYGSRSSPPYPPSAVRNGTPLLPPPSASFHQLKDEGGGLTQPTSAEKNYRSRTSPQSIRIVPLARERWGWVQASRNSGEGSRQVTRTPRFPCPWALKTYAVLGPNPVHKRYDRAHRSHRCIAAVGRPSENLSR